MKVSLLPLHELYAREKITTAVEAAIISKETFTNISPTYCEKVCKLKCKDYKHVQLLNDEELDVLIVQDHMAPMGKFDKTEDGQEKIQRSIIDFICQKAGFAGLKYRITTLLKCKPNDEDFPKGKAPTASKLLKCKPYLLSEIERCKPKVIISLSTAVTKALGLKRHSNSGNRGEIAESQYGNVVITLHPRVLSMIRQNASGNMWGADYFRIIVRDFNKAARMARGDLTVPNLQNSIEFYVKNRIRFAKTLDDVQTIIGQINALPERAIISFDTETTGLDPLDAKAKLLTIQFGWRDPVTGYIVAAVIPLWHRENVFFDPDKAWELITPLLLSKRPKVAHNGKFDILYIYWTTGVRVVGLAFDTLLILHALDSGAQGTYGLKVATWDWLVDLGIAGYEDLLPKLTKASKEPSTWEENEETIEDLNVEYA